MTQVTFMQADFNGDQLPDYLVSEAMFQCRDRQGNDIFAGNYGRLGPEIAFLMSAPAGYREISGFSVNPYELSIERRGARDVLVIEPSHNYWGDVARVVWAWNGQKMEPIERRNKRGQLVDQAGKPVAGGARPPAAASGTSLAAAAAPHQQLTEVSIRLAPRAQQRMAAVKEQVLVSVAIEAEPVRKTPRDWYLDEITVSLGEQQVTLPAAGGVASIGMPPRLAQRAGRIRPGSEIVRMTVTSARRTQVDNVLNCTSMTSPLASLPKAITINCDLIG